VGFTCISARTVVAATQSFGVFRPLLSSQAPPEIADHFLGPRLAGGEDGAVIMMEDPQPPKYSV
jgi:hypothetical protein